MKIKKKNKKTLFFKKKKRDWGENKKKMLKLKRIRGNKKIVYFKTKGWSRIKMKKMKNINKKIFKSLII